MSNPAGCPDVPIPLLQLPEVGLACVFKHVAAGPGGLSSGAAAFSQTCKKLYKLSHQPIVTYCNLHVGKPITYSKHPVWPWLAARCERVDGLRIRIDLLYTSSIHSCPMWHSHLQILAKIANLQLTVSVPPGGMDLTDDHPFVHLWLRQHGHLISHLKIGACFGDGSGIGSDLMTLPQLVQILAPCKSLDLALDSYTESSVKICSLADVRDSLLCLSLQAKNVRQPLRGLTTFACLSRLTELSLSQYHTGEDLWHPLAAVLASRGLPLTM